MIDAWSEIILGWIIVIIISYALSGVYDENKKTGGDEAKRD